jgi:hypothetical protein
MKKKLSVCVELQETGEVTEPTANKLSADQEMTTFIMTS